jgi:hypothetical protein
MRTPPRSSRSPVLFTHSSRMASAANAFAGARGGGCHFLFSTPSPERGGAPVLLTVVDPYGGIARNITIRTRLPIVPNGHN